MRCSRCASVTLVAIACAARGEFISDLLTSGNDEKRALEIKGEQFWQSLLQSAESLQVEEHAQLAADAERVLAELPAENEYVREALREAVDHVRSASDALLQEAARTAQLSVDQLEKPATGSGFGWLFSSFVSTGSQRTVFSQAIKRFAGGGAYSEKLMAHISDRQADILPVLQGAASVTGGVLTDCRTASKRGFDVLKYDIYNKGVPKTPETAKALANRVIEVAGGMRSRFTKYIREAVGNIVGDLQGKEEPAAATVVRSSLDNGPVRLNRERRLRLDEELMNI